MESIDNDKLIKELLQNSRLQLSDSQFSSIILDKISQEKERRYIIKKAVILIAAMIFINCLTLLLLTAFHPHFFTSPSSKVSEFSLNAVAKAIRVIRWIVINSYLIFPLATLLILNKIGMVKNLFRLIC
jgi:hypothetical protein